jgi:signal transduction histidine kinase
MSLILSEAAGNVCAYAGKHNENMSNYAYLFEGLNLKRVVITAFIAVVVTSVIVWGLENTFLDLLVTALCLAMAIMVAVTVAGNMRQRWISREAAQLLAVIPGAMLGTLMTVIVKGRTLAYLIGDEHWRVITTASLGLGFGAVITLIYINRERAARVQNILLRAEAEKNLLEKQVLEARLQLMQAQIEPHFLFNTLANVKHLVESDAQSASHLLDNLIRYLRIAMPQMRETGSTLGREMDMAAAYLEIFKMRMGGRLSYEIQVPAALRDQPFPPMMLITLVENAIKHGVDPCCDAGAVSLKAEAKEGKLVVSVADTGQGMFSNSGGGVGLVNTRERLATLFGRDAKLYLMENQPRGVVANIELPVKRVPGDMLAAT